MQSMNSFKLKTLSLVLACCAAWTSESFANGCSGSSFTLTYSPFCGCWQLCGGYGNALLISDCDDLTDLSINWGDGSPSFPFSFGGALPCHDYQPGTYTATMHIEGYCHSIFGTQTCNITQQVTVSNQPFLFEAHFTTDTVCLGPGVTTFTNQSIIPPGVLNLGYYYDFGDGTTSIGNPNPVHHYDDCGAYDVMLIITGNMLCCDLDGRDTITQRVYVNCPPNTNSNGLGDTDPYIYESWASVTMNEVCLGAPSNFNLTRDPRIITWNYTFADGGSSTLEDPTHTFDYCPPFINWTNISLTNDRGCTNILDTVAVVHCPVFANFASVTGTLCSGDCNGTATINITGGNPNYTIQWGTNPVQNTLTATGLCPGSYDVTVTDNYGCRDTQSLNVFSPNPFVGTINATDIACNGWLTGTAVLNMTGGTAPNSFYWSPNGATTQINSGLAPGTYNVTATDANGCTFTSSATINEPTPITATFTQTNSNCGSCDGNATVTPGGGSGPYTFLWSNGQTTQTATGLCSGIYFVEVTDANQGCTLQFSVAIGNIGADPLSVSTTNVSCANSCDGTATATVTGCPTCTFEWIESNGLVLPQTASTANGLCAGDYIARVTNPGNGCQSVANFSITVPNPLVLTPSSLGITCNGLCDGQVSISVSGGTASYSYQWRDAGNTLVGSTATVGSLCPGTYTVQVLDAAGCTETVTATVATYVFTGITVATSISCFGDCNAQILATGQIGTLPYSFQWDDGANPIGGNSPILANLCAGTYNVTITDATGCAITLPPVTISQPSAITASVSSTPTLCYGDCNGSASVVIVGGTPGYNYQWADALIAPIPSATASVFNNLCAALYHVQITDSNNCKSPWTPITVNQPDSLFYFMNVTQPHCGNNGLGEIDVTISGGTGAVSFTWSTGATTSSISNLAIGNYCFTATDANGCSVTDCANLIQPPALNTLISSAQRNGYNVRCYGDTTVSVELDVSGGVPPFEYRWSDTTRFNNETGVNLPAGTYNVTVTDATGCTIEDNITLSEPPPLVMLETHLDLACPGDSNGTITVNISGGIPVSAQIPYAIHWEYLTDSLSLPDTSATITGLQAGDYYVFAFDTNACIVRDTITIDEPLPLAAIFSVVNGSCNGTGSGFIDLTPSGGTQPFTQQWTWSAGSSTDEDLTALSPDDYFVTITDANGCTVNDTAQVIEPTALTTTISATPALCFGGSDGSIDVGVTGGSPAYSYAWNLVPDTMQDLTSIPSGNYTVVVTDQGGCTITTSIFVDQPAPLFGTGSLEICNGDSAFLGGVWQKFADIYPDTVVSVAGCDSFLDITLSLVDSFIVNIAPTICFGDTFFLNGNTYITSGIFRDVLTASGGCDSIVRTTLTMLPAIGAHTNPLDTATVILGESIGIEVLVNAGVTVQDYVWTPDVGLSCADCATAIATPDAPIEYTIVVSVANDTLVCYDTTSIELFIDSIGQVAIYIPNAFTPNGDGVNDYFMVYGRGFERFRLVIFDRWGDKLFETRDQTVGWDGIYRGKKLNPGVFVYYVDIDFIDGIVPREYIEYKKGSVTLIR